MLCHDHSPSPKRVEMNGQAVIAIPSPVLSRPQLQRRSATSKIKGDLGTISQRYFCHDRVGLLAGANTIVLPRTLARQCPEESGRMPLW
jgi:hypothetical protein